MAYEYDDQNIFAKILRGEIPSSQVAESEHSLAFRDIAPKAPEHILVIPKGAYVTYDHFVLEATEAEILDFSRLVGRICADLGVQPGEGGAGFRLISNAGGHGAQEVPHMHVHILAGAPMGAMVGQA